MQKGALTRAGAAALALAALAAAADPGWHDDRSITVNGVERYFRYFMPEAPSSQQPPVVFFLHGGGTSMRVAMPPARTGSAAWPQVAEDHGFILVVPNGTNAQTGDTFGDQQAWNDCRLDALDVIGDDVAFLEALVEWSLQSLGVDPQRVYFGGSSNGGSMTYRMAAEVPERVAAAAPFISNAAAVSECRLPLRPVPMMITLGTADPLMPFNGGEVSESRSFVRSAAQTVDIWLAANGLRGVEPVERALPDLEPADGSTITEQLFSTPENAAPLRLLNVLGGGHAMPSTTRLLPAAVEVVLGRQNHDIEGAAEAWAFMSQFRAEHTPSDAALAGTPKTMPPGDAADDANGPGRLFDSVHVPRLTDFQEGTNGAALVDLNRDGLLDVVTVTTEPLKLGLNDAEVRDRLRFLINRGNLELVEQSITLAGSAATPQDLGQGWRGSQIPALADFDDDGWLDLFVSRQCPCEGGEVRPGFTPVGNSLFISDGSFHRFVDRSEALGVLNELAYNRQPSIGDVNGDGFLDIAVGADNTTNAFEGIPRSVLFVFQPGLQGFDDGQFVDIGGSDLIPDFGSFTGDPAEDKAGPNLRLRDIDNDGDLDLLQSTHVLLGAPPMDARLLPFSPVTYRQGVFTWRNRLAETGAFRFEKSTGNDLAAEARLAFDEAAGVYAPATDARAPGLAYLQTADLDNDGLFDVVAVDASDKTFTPKTLDVGGRLWRNKGGFQFTEATAGAGLDSLNDSYGDWHGFFDNPVPAAATVAKPLTRFLPAQPGLEPIAPIDLRPYHADVIFADFNNDTWMDMVILDRRESDLLETRALFYRNQGDGVFEPVPTTVSGLDSTGIAGEAADLDNDGRVDLFISGDPDNSNDNENLFAGPERYVDKVYRNTGAMGADNNWLRLRFSGIAHAALIGARVEISSAEGERLGTRGVYTNRAYKTASPLQVHFGLGQHEQVNVRVNLPGGEVVGFPELPANRFLELDLTGGESRPVGLAPADMALLEGGWQVESTPGEGFMLDYSAALDQLFVTWFTHTETPQTPSDPPEPGLGGAGQRWLSGLLDVAGSTAQGPLRARQGGAFDSPPTSFEVNPVVGEIEMSLIACDRLRVRYDLFTADRQGSFDLRPLELIVAPESQDNSCEAGSGSTNDVGFLEGGWVNPTTEGEGILFDVGATLPQVFLTWFTYTQAPVLPDNPPSPGVGAPGQRWLTALLELDGDTLEGDLRAGQGGSFDSPPEPGEVNPVVGTMRVEILACDLARVDYTIDTAGISGSFEIQPLEQLVNSAGFQCAGL